VTALGVLRCLGHRVGTEALPRAHVLRQAGEHEQLLGGVERRGGVAGGSPGVGVEGGREPGVAQGQAIEAQGFAFGRLWTLFGTTNQLTAGLALAVIAVYVTKQGRSAMAQLVPLVFLLAMTTWALIVNLQTFIDKGDWLLAPLDLIILVLAGWLIVEAFLGMQRARREPSRVDETIG